MNEPPISIDDLTVNFGDLTVLDGISFDITSGQFLGVVGPNGTGKTTLLQAINGVITPDSGRIRILGDRGMDLSTRERSRRIATVPQESHVGFDFSVRQVVEMGRYPYRSRSGWGDPDGDAVDRALDRTETTALADRSVTTLSGGEQRRVILARALAQETPILLLDEPTASLDINHQVRTLERIDTLVEREKTVIAAIHDLDLAARYCDTVVLLDDGTVRAMGPPREVLTSTAIRRTYDVTATITTDPTTGAASITALRDADPDRDRTVHVLSGQSGQLLARLTRAGFTVTAGVIVENTPAAAVADSLDIETVRNPPQMTIKEAAQRRTRRLIDAADVTVLDDIDIGPVNRAQLELASHAENLVVVEDRPFEQRNHAGKAAADQYDRLCARAAVTPPARLLDAIDRALTEQIPHEHEATPSVSESLE